MAARDWPSLLSIGTNFRFLLVAGGRGLTVEEERGDVEEGIPGFGRGGASSWRLVGGEVFVFHGDIEVGVALDRENPGGAPDVS